MTTAMEQKDTKQSFCSTVVVLTIHSSGPLRSNVVVLYVLLS